MDHAGGRPPGLWLQRLTAIFHIGNARFHNLREDLAMAENAVPKELLLYWHQGWDRAPDLVKRCAATWLARNPLWNVNVMDRDNIEKKVSIPRAVKALNLPLPAFANFIRMSFLKRGGGMGGCYLLVRATAG